MSARNPAIQAPRRLLLARIDGGKQSGLVALTTTDTVETAG
jgi:hypothetical protein